MDALLELFGKYRCHLKRKSQSMGDFLEKNYKDYIEDVKAAMSPKDNLLLGDSVCKIVADHIAAIIENSQKLVEVYRLY